MIFPLHLVSQNSAIIGEAFFETIGIYLKTALIYVDAFKSFNSKMDAGSERLPLRLSKQQVLFIEFLFLLAKNQIDYIFVQSIFFILTAAYLNFSITVIAMNQIKAWDFNSLFFFSDLI